MIVYDNLGFEHCDSIPPYQVCHLPVMFVMQTTIASKRVCLIEKGITSE